MCQDFATESGYEYINGEEFTGTLPWTGDGALLAEFDDGTITSGDWSVLVISHGPTDTSIEAGFNATTLEPCEVEVYDEPENWFKSSYDTVSWSPASIFTDGEAGWGIEPTYGMPQYVKATNPFTREEMEPVEGFSLNYNSIPSTLTNPWVYDPDNVPVNIFLTENECLMPREKFNGATASFIRANDFKLDNRVLFRLGMPEPLVLIMIHFLQLAGSPTIGATVVSEAATDDASGGSHTLYCTFKLNNFRLAGRRSRDAAAGVRTNRNVLRLLKVVNSIYYG